MTVQAHLKRTESELKTTKKNNMKITILNQTYRGGEYVM